MYKYMYFSLNQISFQNGHFFRVKTVSAMFVFDQFEISFLNKMYKIYREKTTTIKLFVCLLGNRKERNRKTTKTLHCIISCQMRKKVETF